jgi:hypothetical protein
MNNEKTYHLKNVMLVSFAIIAAFIIGIYLVSLTLGRFQSILLPDTGAGWYYWKLPTLAFWATFTAWVLYILHQVSVWRLIYLLKNQPPLADDQVGQINMKLLIVNGVFIALHLLQTALFYDGLAQTVPVMSSQGSVIVMLVMVLILMNGKRGLFFGKKVKLPAKGVQSVFKVHSYYIAWALVYTFWFHPTEGTWGHLMGFLYIFLLMLQMSLGRTKFHTNIKWITLLEVYVAVHGAVVALEAGNGMWPMFLLGFMLMFIITGMYGIISNKVALVGVSVLYLAIVTLVYSGVLGNANTLADFHQITWIPIILYALVFVLALVFAWVYQLVSKNNASKKAS